MGEGLELERIEFLYGYLYQFDWRNPETGTVTRTFVKEKRLYEEMRAAVKRGANEVPNELLPGVTSI